MESGQTPLPEVWGDRGWPQKNKENHTRDGVEKKSVGHARDGVEKKIKKASRPRMATLL